MKCLFDNQMSPRLAKALKELEGRKGIVVDHIQYKFKHDTPDTDWIRALAKEGDWFVITKDAMIRRRSIERKAWQESGLPIVFLDREWFDLGMWDISWMLIKYWAKVKESIASNKNGESFILFKTGRIGPACPPS